MLDQATPRSSVEASEFEPRFDLHQILGFVWRQWKFIASITALVLVIGSTMLMRLTPLYTATTQILLERQREKAPGAEAILATADPDAAMVEGEMAILRSSVFLRRVVEREHLAADRKVANSDPQSSEESSSIFASVRSLLPWFTAQGAEPATAQLTTAEPTTAEPGSPSDEEIAATEALKGSVLVSRAARFGFVLGISVTSPDPARAARLANAVAYAYLVDKLDTRFEAAKRASAWLNDRIVELRNQLHDLEEAVTQFRTAHGLFQSGNVTLSQQQLSELNAKLIDARADAAQKKARVRSPQLVAGQGHRSRKYAGLWVRQHSSSLASTGKCPLPTRGRSFRTIRSTASARRQHSRAGTRPRTLYRRRDPAIVCLHQERL